MEKTHSIHFNDGTFLNVTEKQFQIASRAFNAKMPFSIDGIPYAHHSVSKFSRLSKVAGMDPASYVDLFQLDDGLPRVESTFWKEILEINNQRNKKKKPWIYAKVVEQVMKISKLTEPEYIFQFIDSDPDEIDWTLNKPDVKGGTRINMKACGRCENGWLHGENGAKPCSCNQSAIDFMASKGFKFNN